MTGNSSSSSGSDLGGDWNGTLLDSLAKDFYRTVLSWDDNSGQKKSQLPDGLNDTEVMLVSFSYFSFVFLLM